MEESEEQSDGEEGYVMKMEDNGEEK